MTTDNEEGTRAQAAEILRGLVDEIRLGPSDDGHIKAELFGEIAAIFNLTRDKKTPPGNIVPGGAVSLVAGVGFEPTTFRL